MKKYAMFLIFFIINNVFARDYEVNTWSIYGISYHTGVTSEERSRLNEKNLGLSFGRTLLDGNSRYMLDFGVFENSYFDTATWLGASYTYRIFNYFGGIDVGVNARHWWTERNTYGSKLLQGYGLISINPTNYMKVNMLIRESGPIFYFSVDF